MIGKNDLNKRSQISMIALDDLISEDHLLKKIDIFFTLVLYDEVQDLYSSVVKEID